MTQTIQQPRVATNLKISKLFSDHMVLQRDIPVKVWGWATKGTPVSVSIDDFNTQAVADQANRWVVTIPAHQAGGSYNLKISCHDSTIEIHDIVFGDVWICSGQSNMEWELSNSNDSDKELAAMNYDNIRYVNITRDREFTPLDQFRHEPVWRKATSKEIASFSAVGFHFGKELHLTTSVPIGLIGASWGGTRIELWTSAQALIPFEENREILEQIRSIDCTMDEYELNLNSEFYKFKENHYYHDIGMDEKWFFPAARNHEWKEVIVPSLWNDSISELENYHGTVWFRKKFDIPEEFKGKELRMWFGLINDHDIAWVNGTRVGETFHRENWRCYDVPSAILKSGDNEIVLRVYNVSGKGGFSGIADYFDFYPKNEVNKKIANTAGMWHYRKGSPLPVSNGENLLAKKNDVNLFPTILFNAMINPMINFGAKGVIWYQGESNADKAHRYSALFTAMINDWRNRWGQKQLYFFWVQLANFMARRLEPSESNWALLREAQTKTLALPDTGMATAIDIGETNDIHPRNKKDVGKRLALQALYKVYDRDIICSGPVYKSNKLVNNTIVIRFESTGKGLITSDGETPKGFAIAGEDKKFHWAEVSIDDDTVIVSSTRVEKPCAVRYAWADNPECNLCNDKGLPALPFRTDSW